MNYLGSYERKLTVNDKFCIPTAWRNESKKYVMHLMEDHSVRLIDYDAYVKLQNCPEVRVCAGIRATRYTLIDCSKSWWVKLPIRAGLCLRLQEYAVWAVGVGCGFELWNQRTPEHEKASEGRREILTKLLEQCSEDALGANQQ